MESKSGTEKVTPSQRARDAAADVLQAFDANHYDLCWHGPIRRGERDRHSLVKLLARFEREVAQEAEQRAMEWVREIANSIEVQARCLEQYAESNGFDEKPVPSVFHFQATHFRDLASKLRSLSPAPESTEKAG